MAPTPASLEKGVCQVELRRCRLAEKGRSNNFEVEDCPNNCGRTVVRCRTRFHLALECERRKVRCFFCHRPVASADLKAHLTAAEPGLPPECLALRFQPS